MPKWMTDLMDGGMLREADGVGSGTAAADPKKANGAAAAAAVDADDEDDEDADDPVTERVARKEQYREPTRYERRLRTENAAKRTENKTLKAQIADMQKKYDTDLAAVRTASKSELEAAVATANKSGREALIDIRLEAEAVKAGLVDADALRLINKTEAGIKIGDDGKIVGIAEAIEALKKGKPYLFGAVKTGTTTQTTETPKPAVTTNKSALEMDDKEWAAEKRRMGFGR